MKKVVGSIVLMLVGAVLGGIVVGPASGHVGDKVDHLWSQHLKSRVANVALETSEVSYAEHEGIVGDGTSQTLDVMCETGRALGGGSFLQAGEIDRFFFFGDKPVLNEDGDPVGWQDEVFNDSGLDAAWIVYVICGS